jgi:hypothetical protein
LILPPDLSIVPTPEAPPQQFLHHPRHHLLADATLRKMFGQDKVTMFALSKHLAQHLK